MFDRWVIDASMSHDGMLCFCPIEGDINGDFTVIEGMNYIGAKPPGQLVAIVHPDGQAAVDRWMNANADVLARLEKDIKQASK